MRFQLLQVETSRLGYVSIIAHSSRKILIDFRSSQKKKKKKKKKKTSRNFMALFIVFWLVVKKILGILKQVMALDLSEENFNVNL